MKAVGFKFIRHQTIGFLNNKVSYKIQHNVCKNIQYFNRYHSGCCIKQTMEPDNCRLHTQIHN